MSSITILNDPLATGGTFPQDVNDAGAIVGYYIDAQGSHGFTYTNGTFSTTPTLIIAGGINNAGQIVGSTASSATHPSDINNAAQVVGSFTASDNTTQSFFSGSASQL